MPRHSKTCATAVICGGVSGQDEAKNSMFDKICGDLVARDQESLFERSICASSVVPSTVGCVFGPFGRPITACWLASPGPSRSHLGQGMFAQRKCATAR